MNFKPPVVRTPGKVYEFKIAGDGHAWLRVLAREATYWTYVIRNRRRWLGTADGLATQRKKAVACLTTLGLSEDELREIGRSKRAEVSIPYESEDLGWEARIFPWEYVLSCATSGGLTVFRHLAVTKSRRARPAELKRVLYVESTPGGVGKGYSFDSEEALVKSNLGLEWRALHDPTPERLSKEIEGFKPDVVHLAGFDSHQGLYLQNLETADRLRETSAAFQDGEVFDGYMMTDAERKPMTVDAETLGRVLTGIYHPGAAKGHKPFLVGFSIWNSGARVAAMAVAAGVTTAIGFQDSLDDELMELFFASFYRLIKRKDCDVCLSFDDALRLVHRQPGVASGSGVIVWSAQSLVALETAIQQPKTEEEPRKRILPSEIKKIPHHEVLEITPKGIVACPELNYSALHNRQPLFDSFTLLNQSAQKLGKDTLADLGDVDVRVVLSAGSETACFERRLTLSGPIVDLRREVHVPLTSELLRSARETVNSSMLVEISWGSVIYRDTHPVRLLPIDQWRDNESDGLWLPSFVLPRDPAVVKLVEKAQRYVRVLRDDPSSGFDGYQSINPNEPDPYGEVDLQVQAIWSTVIHELELGYVNPPPTYSNKMDSQRLRTPSMTINSQCGTCIDLALLLAACLELVDIYPVIFLLNDHAFPGYWRSPECQSNLIKVNISGDELQGEGKQRTQFAGSQRHPWWLKGSAYDEIVQQVRLGNLVPLESVWLTEHSGFWAAVEGGQDNLKSRKRFHSMLDIARAREANVTPIPVWGSHA